MMKPRSSSRVATEQAMSGRNKSESLTNTPAVQRNQAQLANAQVAAQAIRKRRSSINVYDQPSSLNSRLRQLETDMLRLDEDRTKLFDDTHTALAQYELRLNEIHAILKSRQDNVDKYVEDMKLLLQAKEDFEKQAKMLHEKHDRVHEKFMHRETTISREIKLLKNKFELLEKNRQFRNILQKSGNTTDDNLNDDLASGLGPLETPRTTSETVSEADTMQLQNGARISGQRQPRSGAKNVRIKLSKLNPFHRLINPILSLGNMRRMSRKSNRVSSVSVSPAEPGSDQQDGKPPEADGGASGNTVKLDEKHGKKRPNLMTRLFGK